MIDGDLFIEICARIALGVLSLALLLTIVRIVIGPTLPDRVLALDTLTATAIGFIAVIGIRSGFPLYVDIAIALGLVGFPSAVAFAPFVLGAGRAGHEPADCHPRRPDDGGRRAVRPDRRHRHPALR